ncbi:Gag-Pro-Pol polyprotein [Acropora cervicornis]|uniref:Gag-Pro-Pol polyprotein n=1 Tax=Acropora cervicornis TaxID=6130 RepID=A0AAD9URW6_ACRCE|nr:Gag-Pro-Pol polyprotein [Acropora cervicornis]
MKTVIVGSILLAIFSCCIYPGSGTTALDHETYKIFVQVIKGEFSIPVTERTAKINSARVRFWRNKDNLSLRGGVLCFKGKAIAKKSALEKVVKKSFKTSKGSGTRKLYHRLKDSYSGISERNVHKVLLKSTIHQKLNARFQNRPRLRPIRARDVQVRHQIDLVDMNKLCTKYKGKVFRYVLSVMDVFSRYHWLVPLQRKRSSHVARELIRIYREHGAPLVLQHDQGAEFDGAVSRLCKQLQIKVIKGRPYHPQSQGKVERAHRTFKKKLRYDFLSTKKAGVNWPRGASTLRTGTKPRSKGRTRLEISI